MRITIVYKRESNLHFKYRLISAMIINNENLRVLLQCIQSKNITAWFGIIWMFWMCLLRLRSMHDMYLALQKIANANSKSTRYEDRDFCFSPRHASSSCTTISPTYFSSLRLPFDITGIYAHFLDVYHL